MPEPHGKPCCPALFNEASVNLCCDILCWVQLPPPFAIALHWSWSSGTMPPDRRSDRLRIAQCSLSHLHGPRPAWCAILAATAPERHGLAPLCQGNNYGRITQACRVQATAAPKINRVDIEARDLVQRGHARAKIADIWGLGWWQKVTGRYFSIFCQ